MADEQVLANPTWMADIRFYFRDVDIQHMAAKGFDLATYDGVKTDALSIFAQTAPPTPSMPPDKEGQWSAERSQTFLNWINNSFPLGTATTPAAGGVRPLTAAPAERVRKNVASLGTDEVEKLKTAFQTLMDRPPTDPNSYYRLAAIHGLPHPYCLHHEDRFAPWHRVYLKIMEDQLRTVPGCEDLTLPYWDIRTPMPDVLQHPPFDKYELQANPGGGFFPYTTKRFTLQQIADNLAAFGVIGEIDTALGQSLWGRFNDGGYQKFSIQAHDGGHGSIGPTMGNPDVSAFDPVFWFFHCNLDRIWLSWQHNAHAETLTGFLSTVSSQLFWKPPFNAMPPWTPPDPNSTTSDQTIEYGIAYDELDSAVKEGVTLENMTGNTLAARSFTIKRSSPVSVRVKDIDRLSIPGTFAVHLLGDGEPIAKRAFFQPNSPTDCENCRQHALVNIDFRLDQEQVLDKKLSVAIEVLGQEEMGTNFPLKQAGDPTINARLLIEDE